MLLSLTGCFVFTTGNVSVLLLKHLGGARHVLDNDALLVGKAFFQNLLQFNL